MSKVTRCDGCGHELDPPVVSGDRADGHGGGGVDMPSGAFDWCARCTRVAFGAVTAYNTRRLPQGPSSVTQGLRDWVRPRRHAVPPDDTRVLNDPRSGM